MSKTIDGVPRELLGQILPELRAGSYEEQELSALLAAPVVERQEPVEIGYIEHRREFEWCEAAVMNRLIWTMPPGQRHTIPQHYKVMLYTSPPAPVAVSELCQQLESVMAMFAPGEDKTNRTLIAARACLDKVKELNQ